MAIAEKEMLQQHFLEEGGKRDIVFGIQQAISFARKVAAGERVDRKKYDFDDKFIREVHKRVAYNTGHEGQLRQKGAFEIGGIPLAPPHELPTKFYLYGQWLKKNTAELKRNIDNPIKALEVAAAAHYGLTMPPHHPFENGNGRTARVTANSILMLTTRELRVHHKAIPPIPMMRSFNRDDRPYINALEHIYNYGDLSCLMTFMGKKWIDCLESRYLDVYAVAPRPLNYADGKLLDSIESKLLDLKKFTSEHCNNTSEFNSPTTSSIRFPVPDYFSINNLHP